MVIIIIINVKNIIYMCVCNYLFVHSYIGNCINFTQSYCLVIICFCNGIVHLLDSVCQQSNQTMFSHSWLPWKCQHRDYRVNLPVTPPLSSTSHLLGLSKNWTTLLKINVTLEWTQETSPCFTLPVMCRQSG